jgi:uncharacterized alpha-E superfamily protein
VTTTAGGDVLLSRVAEAVYWAGRYLERAEAAARLVEAHTELYLDLPRSAGVGWAPLLAVSGSEGAFLERYPAPTEEAVVRFMAIDTANPGSIVASLGWARENLRITRALLPRASWEVVNQLYLSTAESSRAAVDRRTRLAWMEGVVRQCQLLGGLLSGTMSHDDAYAFLEVGRSIERADMTTRVLDVQAGILTGEEADRLGPYADVTWMSVLRSLAADQMFRRAARNGVSGPEALRFLLKDQQFPRSVEHCLIAVSRALLELPSYDEPMAGCARVQRLLEEAEAEATSPASVGLHEYLDRLQEGISALDGLLTRTYFRAAHTAPDDVLVPTG